MGVLCCIGKMIVNMRYFDTKQHHKPHVHVVYNGSVAVVAVDGELLAGGLPPRQMRILDGWLAKREERVYAAWNLVVQGKQFEKIEDEEVFNNYRLDYETLTWLDGEVDVAPEFVFENGASVAV